MCISLTRRDAITATEKQQQPQQQPQQLPLLQPQHQQKLLQYLLKTTLALARWALRKWAPIIY